VKPNRDESLFATTWVHVHEEDNEEGALYRPEDADIPLSRRPRERIRFHADGSACVLNAGPDDRHVEKPATWREESGAIILHESDSGRQRRVVRREPDRLTIQ
jgi:hypothetical protein